MISRRTDMVLIDAAIKRARQNELPEAVITWLKAEQATNNQRILLADERREQATKLSGWAAEQALDEYRTRIEYLRDVGKFLKTHLTKS